jgi:hydrogenase nickel incorporation protein HypA/HybF
VHECALAEEVIAIVRAKLKENGRSRATRIDLVIGELTSVVPEALETAFQSLSVGTPVEGAKLKYRLKRLKARCGSCRRVFRVKDFDYGCPSCGKGPCEIIQGREMFVKSIEAE